MSPARTSATTHSRSTILRDVGIACPTPAKCTGSCRVTIASTTPTRTCGASPDTKNPLGSAPLWDRLERRNGHLRIWGHTTGPTGRARGQSQSLRVRESKYSCQVARRTLGYTKVRYCSIAKGADAHPSETIQTQVATRVSCTPASNLIELNSLVRKDVFYSTVVKHSRKRPDSYRGRCTAIPGLRGRLTVASSVFIKQMSSLWPEEWGKSYVSRETSFIPQSCATLSACTSSLASI